MSGGSKSKQKGNRGERRIAALLREAGLIADRVPMSGALKFLGRAYRGDVQLDLALLSDPLVCEVKSYKNKFGQLYAWLGDDKDLLIVKDDRQEPLVVCRLGLATLILNIVEFAARSGITLSVDKAEGPASGHA
jgi:hypothetical protein